MLALHFDGSHAQVIESASPEDRDGMAIVRVTLAGVCNTDLEIVKGYMGFRGTLGHEFVGVVEHGPTLWLHKRVVAGINFACGSCESCRAGMGRHCPSRTVMGILGADGALAEQVAVPVANLHEVPATLSDETAVFAEPLAAAFEILEQIHLTPNTRCVVIGDGKLGLLISQALFTSGAEILAVGRHPEKLAILSRRGINTVLASDWSKTPADLVVEASGTAEGFALAVEATKPRGTLVLKSTVAGASTVHLAPLVINEIRVVGSRCGSFQPALRALKHESIDVASLIDERYPLARAQDALRRAAEPGSLKVLVTPS